MNEPRAPLGPERLTANRLLGALSDADRRRLASQFEEVHLELGDVLFKGRGRLDAGYFPLTAVASLLTELDGTSGVEVATIGNEGLVGLPLSWGMTVANPRERVQIQVPGDVLRLEAEAFVGDLHDIPGFRRIVDRYTQAYVSQIGQQVACNGVHSIEERCARWLLLTHDRTSADVFPLTQEFLSQMLGVRRGSVSLVAGMFQQAGFISYSRGRVTITDRALTVQAEDRCS